jgi:multiple sugar transport system substrate-binding protein
VAISAGTKNPEVAAAYAAYVASPDVQRGIYFAAGGQPGHRVAWLDEGVNAASSDFFQDTLDALDRAYLRPRYLGYMEVQERSGDLIHEWLAKGGSADTLLDSLDELYRASEPEGKE